MSLCPLCGSPDRIDYHDRKAAVCAGCGALERQRALGRDILAGLQPRGSAKVLEVGPRSPFVFGGYLAAQGWVWEGVDKRAVREAGDPGTFDSFITHDRDLADLHGLRSRTYELVLLQHVLEEVLDYRAALDELARVVEPGGRALLEIPWAPDQGHTTARPPGSAYGNRWRFGQDIRDELQHRFAGGVEVRRISEERYSGDVFVCTGA